MLSVHSFRSQRQRRAAPAAIFLVVLAACGAPTSDTTEPLLTIGTSSPIDSTTTTPAEDGQMAKLSVAQQETLDRLVAAFDAGDTDAVLSLWGPEGDHYRHQIEADLAMGGRWSDVACAAGTYSGQRCDLLYTNDLLAALGAPLLEAHVRIEMTDDGTIEDWVYDRGNLATTAVILLPFSEWVGTTDPDAAQEMFDWNGFARQTPEAVELWTRKVAEYLETLG